MGSTPPASAPSELTKEVLSSRRKWETTHTLAGRGGKTFRVIDPEPYSRGSASYIEKKRKHASSHITRTLEERRHDLNNASTD